MNAPDLTVIVVSYNTRDLTLRCLETLYATTRHTSFRTVVFDNASQDGSAEAVRRAFPDVEVIAWPENVGFARANNIVASRAQTDWLLLLNPDTECHPGAVDTLLQFAQQNPHAGITGGRTVFPDGRLNPASCWMRITPWSAFCKAVGLSSVFHNTQLFNPEGIGGWARDSEREVDIVVGCFLMVSRSLWTRLGGFDPRYFMYGEEADLCLRARKLGYRPRITPNAQIMHIVGASSAARADKYVLSAKARATLMADHWPRWLHPFGRACLFGWAGSRALTAKVLALCTGQHSGADEWVRIWAARADWSRGYPHG